MIFERYTGGGTVCPVQQVPASQAANFGSCWNRPRRSDADLAAPSWTGTEMIVWGGVSGEESGAPLAHQGAAYNPATDTWRILPDGPLPARKWPSAVWTGTQVLLSSGSGLAVYDPAANRWEQLPSGPLLAAETTTVWTGHEILAASSASAASYDPPTRTWHTIPAPTGPTLFYDGRLVWTGDAAYFFTVDRLNDIRP